jgi:predicted RNase H-like HicB family nuclease
MITRYVARALTRAQYRLLEDGTFAATVRGLRGVIATGRTLEQCRGTLADVVEEWVLVRVARGLAVPALDGVTVT